MFQIWSSALIMFQIWCAVAQNLAIGYYFQRKFDRFVSTRLGASSAPPSSPKRPVRARRVSSVSSVARIIPPMNRVRRQTTPTARYGPPKANPA